MAKCELRSKIYTNCINALRSVEEISQLNLDHARDVGNKSEPLIRRGRQAGGCQRHGGRQSSQRHTSSQPSTFGQRYTPVPTSSRRPTSGQRPTSGPCHTPMPISTRRHTPMPTSSQHHTPVHDHTMEEASQTTYEMCLDTAYDIGSMAHDDASPSHTFANAHTSQSPSMRSNGTCPPPSPSTSPLPTTHTSLPLTIGTTPAVVHGRDEKRFMPTLGHAYRVHPDTDTQPPHQSLHTLRIGREGRNGHGHILLIVGLDMVL